MSIGYLPEAERKTGFIGFQIDQHTRDLFADQANDQGLTMSRICRTLIEQWLAEQDDKNTEK